MRLGHLRIEVKRPPRAEFRGVQIVGIALCQAQIAPGQRIVRRQTRGLFKTRTRLFEASEPVTHQPTEVVGIRMFREIAQRDRARIIGLIVGTALVGDMRALERIDAGGGHGDRTRACLAAAFFVLLAAATRTRIVSFRLHRHREQNQNTSSA